jgi:hypothetical protein
MGVGDHMAPIRHHEAGAGMSLMRGLRRGCRLPTPTIGGLDTGQQVDDVRPGRKKRSMK